MRYRAFSKLLLAFSRVTFFMGHPCCICGSECYCHGDIDDVVVSKTPYNCEGCGCDMYEDDDDLFDFDDDYTYYCEHCKEDYEHSGECPKCHHQLEPKY